MSDHDPHRLPNTVTPSHYELRLVPELDAATFSGTAEITVIVHEPVTRLSFHCLDLDLDEVSLTSDAETLTGTVTVDPTSETATLSLSAEAGPGRWTLRTRFTGVLNDKLVGFYRSTFVDDTGAVRTLACTQFESTHARRAFPCWDEPAFKATFGVTLVVPEDLLAVSNAAVISDVATGDGRREVRFAPTMKMSTYLVAFVVGPLEATDPADVDGVPLRVITPPGKLHLTDFALDVGAFSLRFLRDWYGIDYPGDKVDLVAIPDFSFGAMENLGCITFRETALLLDPERSTQPEQQRVADVVAHELAHMWFGDLVTMSWWNGIWLNEAFATFMEMLTVDAYRPDWARWVDFGLARSAAFDTDSLSGTRPIEYEVITADDAEGMFDVLTYEKGASVVRMLQQFLGEDRFQAGIRHYLDRNRYANTETTDLWDAIEHATGEPVRSMMDSWIFRPGHPTITVERTETPGILRVTQDLFTFAADAAADVAPLDRSPRSVPVVLRLGTGDTTAVHRVLVDQAEITTDVGTAPDWIVGNNASDGFYRVELTDEDLDELGRRANDHLTPLERYSLVEDEWALVLAGRGSIERVLGLIEHLAEETDLSVWQRMLGVATAFDRALSPASEGAGDLELTTWVRSLVGPALGRLGPAPSEGEPDRIRTLRGVLFEAHGRIGRDPATIAQATELFARLPTADPPVDADMADATVKLAARDADETTWSEILRRSRAATTPQDRLRHQGALADSSDPELVLRFCELILTDEIRTQDGPFLLRRALSNPSTSALVWPFIDQNWAAIGERFPSAAIPRLLDGIRTIGDRTLATSVKDFLARHPVPQGEAVVRQHMERMWVTVAATDRIRSEWRPRTGPPR